MVAARAVEESAPVSALKGIERLLDALTDVLARGRQIGALVTID